MSNETKQEVFNEAVNELDDVLPDTALFGSEYITDLVGELRTRYAAAMPDYLPVIPKNVANYLTDCKRANTTIGTSLSGNIVLFSHARSHDMIHDILSWLRPSDNQDLFARAWLDGYVVED